MCRRVSVLFLIIAIPLADRPSLRAQAPIQITNVSIGLPAANKSRKVRIGAWTPVYVELQAGSTAIDPQSHELVIKTTDGNGVASERAAEIPAVAAQSKATILTYGKIDNQTGNLSLSVRRINDKAIVHEMEDKHPELSDLVRPSSTLYLTIGPSPPAFEKTLTDAQKQAERDKKGSKEVLHFATFARLEDLPTKWYGYDGVDVMILPTSNPLSGDLLQSAAHFDAIVEWVKTGGRLVVSVGEGYRALANASGFKALLDCELKEPQGKQEVTALSLWARRGEHPLRGVTVPDVVPGIGVAVLVREPGAGRPLVVEAPCGRGRVLLLAVDVTAPQLASWPALAGLWSRVHHVMAPRQPLQRSEGRSAARSSQARELGSALQRGLETYDDVSVVSFGWIILLIVLLVVVVGPLEYVLLKKLVKRMEWTWITFPVLVVTISVGTYLIADSIKGDELRINKVDVVDVDLKHGTIHGTTWVTLFSPRIKSYNVGTDVAWLAPGDLREARRQWTSTLHPPDNSIGGTERPAAASVYRRPYSYEKQGNGLRGVPIPTWASRSFAAEWHAAIKENAVRHRILDVDLSRDRDNRNLILGTLTNRLPVALRDVWYFHKGSWFKIPIPLTPGVPWRIGIQGSKVGVDNKNNTTQWFAKPIGREDELADEADAGNVPSPNDLMKSILFHAHDADPRGNWRNSALRHLDQGWRLQPLETLEQTGREQYLEEIILVARVPAAQSGADGASPTRLWLGRLPDDGERPPIQGRLRQQTYFRAFIPLPPK